MGLKLRLWGNTKLPDPNCQVCGGTGKVPPSYYSTDGVGGGLTGKKIDKPVQVDCACTKNLGGLDLPH